MHALKILLQCSDPFMLAHGGAQIQIEQTAVALKKNGVDVDYVRWWDDQQTADVIHFYGRMPTEHIKLAHQKGVKVVLTELLTAQGSRSPVQLALQRLSTNIFRRILPGTFTARMAWDSYRLADACVANTPWEAHLMTYLFGAPKQRVHVVANGVEEVFFNSPPGVRGKWLVCTATITGRKRVLELAEAAVRAQTPVWIIGRAYADSDAYAQRFFALAKQHPEVVRYDGPRHDRAQLAQIYREARGFVLLSSMETRSLASEEAAACECPLLLSDLPWARSTFGNTVKYCPVTESVGQTATALRAFYDAAPSLPAPLRPTSWIEIGRQFKLVYEQVLRTSR